MEIGNIFMNKRFSMHMLRCTMACLAISIFCSCVNKKSKKDYRSTTKVCNNLYVETFSVFGNGALGGDLLSEYLTDSINFRIYIGAFDDYSENYSYTLDNGLVIVEKINRDDKNNIKILRKDTLNLVKLKKRRVFE